MLSCEDNSVSSSELLSVQAEPDRGNLVWLASYPKSGNTWTRAFLTSYCLPKSDLPMLERIGWISMVNSRPKFDIQMGIASVDLRGDEILEHRRTYHEHLSSNAQKVTYFKVHDSYFRTRSGEPLFGPKATRLAVYIVRHPFDVAVSYANHSSCPVDESIACMNDPYQDLPQGATFCATQFADRLDSWSNHVLSWLDQRDVPVFWMRYEDMKKDPCGEFTRLVQAIGLPLDPVRVQAACADAAFDKLQEEERREGFKEKMIGCKTFFNQGETGSGRRLLSDAQKKLLTFNHGDVMTRLGYLDT